MSHRAGAGNVGIGLIAIAAGGLVALAGGNYFLVARRLAPPVPAPQAMKLEDLERALDERRKADAEAAEKQRFKKEAIQLKIGRPLMVEFEHAHNRSQYLIGTRSGRPFGWLMRLKGVNPKEGRRAPRLLDSKGSSGQAWKKVRPTI